MVITVEILNDEALELLRNLEKLRVINMDKPKITQDVHVLNEVEGHYFQDLDQVAHAIDLYEEALAIFIRLCKLENIKPENRARHIAEWYFQKAILADQKTKQETEHKEYTDKKPSRFAGRISKKTAESLQRQLEEMREEWK